MGAPEAGMPGLIIASLCYLPCFHRRLKSEIHGVPVGFKALRRAENKGVFILANGPHPSWWARPLSGIIQKRSPTLALEYSR
jgi:hypothetical protein